ncbi:hypothetical protein JQN72_10845 [Phycicoccus sp. CSK15P-2]|uniref:hypothetical protein n=1 Tax=Phycicoccus sp. CSK15P-2 TaxID=2807627 RepID=UPI00194EED73|nr:hypothetical protein [Phycicoccus sp. CSK15P-2]MBM6404739.1 hypothetical protein [Phycicoccus sp. CSK15P-2]
MTEWRNTSGTASSTRDDLEPGGDDAGADDAGADDAGADDLGRRVHVDLPRVAPEDMVTTHDVDTARDPEGGRDTERDFMLRYAGGGI